jgi:hypothetical protein
MLAVAGTFGNLMLNIGVEYGASIHCLKAGNPDALVVGVDTIGDDKFEGDRNGIQFIRGDSREVELPYRFDVTFIDGCHSYKCVKADIANLAPITNKLLLFHDYCKDGRGVYSGVVRAVDEWQTDKWERIAHLDRMVVFRRVRDEERAER